MLIAIVSPQAYSVAVVLGVVTGVALCVGARRRPGPWTVVAARMIALVLVADAVSWTVVLVRAGDWSPTTSLPLALCNMAALVAAAACWWRIQVLVELTYFWGLAGTLQAVVTPDLTAPFPELEFFQYVSGHLAIVLAAVFLVFGLGLHPTKGAGIRTFAITLGYTAFVGAVDAVSGANYMFLRHPPSMWTLLDVLGPWPWYLVSGTVIAAVLVTLLNAPFFFAQRRDAARSPGSLVGAWRGSGGAEGRTGTEPSST